MPHTTTYTPILVGLKKILAPKNPGNTPNKNQGTLMFRHKRRAEIICDGAADVICSPRVTAAG